MDIPTVKNAKDWKYFAKGAANILFVYVGSNESLKNKLLRLRLYKKEEDYVPTVELYRFIQERCKPLLSPLLIDVQLVQLAPEFVAGLQTEGHQLMESELFAFLLPNILYGTYKKLHLSKHCQLYIDANYDAAIFEIKPKWLYDNNGSNYCRTCLLNQYKGKSRHFCPLDLLHENRADQVVADMLSLVAKEDITNLYKHGIPIRELLVTYLRDINNVFQRLRMLQKVTRENDKIINLGSISDVSDELSLIMTLRDVGVFIKFEKFKLVGLHEEKLVNIEKYGQFQISCYIYDLDLKSKRKYIHWVDVEQKLAPIYNSHNTDWNRCINSQTDSIGI